MLSKHGAALDGIELILASSRIEQGPAMKRYQLQSKFYKPNPGMVVNDCGCRMNCQVQTSRLCAQRQASWH